MSWARSNRSTEQPFSARAHADITPLIPPPITAIFTAAYPPCRAWFAMSRSKTQPFREPLWDPTHAEHDKLPVSGCVHYIARAAGHLPVDPLSYRGRGSEQSVVGHTCGHR